ncbi:MAG: DUF5715 family protein [Gemmatimonadota bacterium]
MKTAVAILVAGAAILAGAAVASAQSLQGSPQTMRRQHSIAVENDFSFLKTSDQVRRFVDAGLLTRLPGSSDYGLAGVSYPYARPALKLFVERLSAQYHAACGEKLIVTSLTRPVQKQPRNASDLSVHPAGMAVDLRVSTSRACRGWLEDTLLSLERQGVLDATREQSPPHYHVALFTGSYTQYVARVSGSRGTTTLVAAVETAVSQTGSRNPAAQSEPRTSAAVPVLMTTAAVAADVSPAEPASHEYRVNRGDSLWSIARRNGTTVEALQQLNGLRSSAITAGQIIMLPVAVVDPDS